MDNPLLEPLNAPQRALVDTIWGPLAQHNRGPVWGWVAHELDKQGHDADRTLSSFPVLTEPDGRMHYGAIWAPRDRYLQVEDEVSLTFAGLFHVPDSELLRTVYLRMLRALDGAVRNVDALDPFRPLQRLPQRFVDGIKAEIWNVSGVASDEDFEQLQVAVIRLADREPFSSPIPPGPDQEKTFLSGSAAATLNPSAAPVLRALRPHLDSPQAYLDYLHGRWRVPVSAALPRSADPTDIPRALTHLDTVWELAFGRPLLAPCQPAVVIRFATVCQTEGDFNSLMSALADVMSRFTSPAATKPAGTKQLEKVLDYLQSKQPLEPGPMEQIAAAFNNLISLREIRVAGQHADAGTKAMKAYQKLGLPYPPQNWQAAWDEIANIARGSLDMVREEINAARGTLTPPA